MSALAAHALPVLARFAPACSPPTFLRLHLLAVAAVRTTGRRTASDRLRPLGHRAQGAPAGYPRVLSEARWSGLRPAARRTRRRLRRSWPAGTVPSVGADTVTEHPGRQARGQARHRDPVRSGQSYTAGRWGHTGVVLAVLVRSPCAPRPWALPVPVALYRSRKDNRHRGRPPQTPARVLPVLRRLRLRWFPDRPFRLAGDAGYGNHDMAHFAPPTPGRLPRVSKFPPRANRYEPAPPVPGKEPAGRAGRAPSCPARRRWPFRRNARG